MHGIHTRPKSSKDTRFNFCSVLCIAKFSMFLNGLFLKATRKMMNESDWEEKLGLIWTGKYEWKVEIILEKFTKNNFIILNKDCFG